MGLGKLEFASSQVSVMQNQLTALRPQLLETSDETEKLMIKIEQDTIQVTMVFVGFLSFLSFVSERELKFGIKMNLKGYSKTSLHLNFYKIEC
jgi:hypothetical protein